MEEGEEQPFEDGVHPHHEKPSCSGKLTNIKQWKLREDLSHIKKVKKEIWQGISWG